MDSLTRSYVSEQFNLNQEIFLEAIQPKVSHFNG